MTFFFQPARAEAGFNVPFVKVSLAFREEAKNRGNYTVTGTVLFSSIECHCQSSQTKVLLKL